MLPIIGCGGKTQLQNKDCLGSLSLPAPRRATPACSGVWFADQRTRVNHNGASGVYQGAGELSESSERLQKEK